MGRFRNASVGQVTRKARIEIIPMIDTIFFLLVFFMFTSLSMVQMKGMGVSLPKDNASVTKPPPMAIVTVNKTGDYFIGTQHVEPDDLYPDLQAKVTADPRTVIVVNVDKAQSVQTLILVMDAVNSITTPSGDSAAVMIATQPVNPNGSNQTATGAGAL